MPHSMNSGLSHSQKRVRRLAALFAGAVVRCWAGVAYRCLPCSSPPLVAPVALRFLQSFSPTTCFQIVVKIMMLFASGAHARKHAAEALAPVWHMGATPNHLRPGFVHSPSIPKPGDVVFH